MKARTYLVGVGLFACALFAQVNSACADEDYKNLKVLANNGKDLEKGMKELSKALDVKCAACHVKGKFDKDDVKAKESARKFFQAAVGEADAAKRDAALKELLVALKLESAKKPDALWAGLQKLQLKK